MKRSPPDCKRKGFLKTLEKEQLPGAQLVRDGVPCPQAKGSCVYLKVYKCVLSDTFQAGCFLNSAPLGVGLTGAPQAPINYAQRLHVKATKRSGVPEGFSLYMEWRMV